MNTRLFKMYDIARCKCGLITELNKEATVDLTLKDDLGRPLSDEAALHSGRFKVKCQGCELNFCAECKTEPYHLGYTCKGYAHYLDTRECRFCLSKFATPAVSEYPVFKEVCNNDACVALMNLSCEKQHTECLHACNGCRGETSCLPCLRP